MARAKKATEKQEIRFKAPEEEAADAVRLITHRLEMIAMDASEARANLMQMLDRHGMLIALETVGCEDLIQKESLYRLIMPIYDGIRIEVFTTAPVYTQLEILERLINEREQWVRSRTEMARSSSWLRNAVSQTSYQAMFHYVFAGHDGFYELREAIEAGRAALQKALVKIQ
jgi:hypothetical protein